MSDVIEKISALRAKRVALNKEIEEDGKNLFLAASAEIFAANPQLVSYSWKQYTPYFNDGDSCEFSANTEYFNVKVSSDPAAADEDEDEDDDEFSTWGLDKKANLSPKEKAGLAIGDLLELFEDDDYQMMFGDHVKVTVTVDGVEVDEYQHD